MKDFHYTYKITLLKNEFNGHYYLGKHSTNNLNDNYLGSGKIIKRYFKKYGAIEGVTYNKEIVAFYDNDDDLNEAELDLIGTKHKDDPMCLNLVAGGGYNDEVAEKISMAAKKEPRHLTDEQRKYISERTKAGMNNPETRRKCSENAKKTKNRKGTHQNEEVKQLISELKKGNKNRLGKPFTDKSKAQISKSLKEYYKTHKRKRQYNEDGSCKYITIEVNE